MGSAPDCSDVSALFSPGSLLRRVCGRGWGVLGGLLVERYEGMGEGGVREVVVNAAGLQMCEEGVGLVEERAGVESVKKNWFNSLA